MFEVLISRVAPRAPVRRSSCGKAGAEPPVSPSTDTPETHAMWHLLAPATLARRFTVVRPNLRRRPGPAPDRDRITTSTGPRRRADPLASRPRRDHGGARPEALRRGRPRPRGAGGVSPGVLYHPGRVAALAVLDIVPTLETWNRTDMRRALASFHWQMLAQPEPLPELTIGAEPDFYLERLLRSWAAPSGFAFAAGSPGRLPPGVPRSRGGSMLTAVTHRAGATTSTTSWTGRTDRRAEG